MAKQLNRDIINISIFMLCLGILVFGLFYKIVLHMQVTSSPKTKIYDPSKELWFFLLFNCVGFTVWPLMVYYLSRAIGITYFVDLSLRTWAEEIIYGPLGSFSQYTILSVLFLLLPYLLFLSLRILIERSR